MLNNINCADLLNSEQAAYKQWDNVGFTGKEHSQHTYISGVNFGANWQKEKDRVLIEELLKALKTSVPFITDKGDLNEFLHAHRIVISTIIKAQEYLNNK